MKFSRKFKVVAWFLTLCLVITLIPDIGYAAATEPAAETTASEQTAESEKTDAAEIQKDDIIEKTETYTTYDLGDGKLETVFHGGQVRFENEDGELEDYDPSLEELKKGEKTVQKHPLTGYSYTNRTGDKKHYLPENLSEDTPVRLEYQDYAIEFALTD